MKSKVTSRDLGAKKLLRTLAQSGEVTVGIHEAEGAAPKDSPPSEDSGDMSLIDVALVHEFGAPEAGIPARSFIRDWEDENRGRHADDMATMARAVVAGRLTPEQALGQLGARFQGEVQKRIADGIDPPLAQRTIDRKGSSKPLIDTGQLRAGVTHTVTVKK